MLPRRLRLHPSTYQRLVRLSKEAERDGAYRVAKRLRAVVLNSEGHTGGALAEILQAPRSKVSEWLQRYRTAGVDGLLEGYRSGRPSELTETQEQQLGDILDSGPGAYGLNTGIWTSPIIAWGIETEFGFSITPAMCANGFTAGDFQCNGPATYWPAPTLRRRSDGTAASVPLLEKPAHDTGRSSSPTKPVSGKTRRSTPPEVASVARRKSP
jgi:transposase